MGAVPGLPRPVRGRKGDGMTDCPMCARAEMTRWEVAKSVIKNAVYRQSLAEIASESIKMSMSIMDSALGIRPPTWYERHRSAWEKSGDIIELERMKRHVAEI